MTWFESILGCSSWVGPSIEPAVQWNVIIKTVHEIGLISGVDLCAKQSSDIVFGRLNSEVAVRRCSGVYRSEVAVRRCSGVYRSDCVLVLALVGLLMFAGKHVSAYLPGLGIQEVLTENKDAAIWKVRYSVTRYIVLSVIAEVFLPQTALLLLTFF